MAVGLALGGVSASATERWAADESFQSPRISRSAIADRVTEGPDGKLYLSFFNGGTLTGVKDQPQQGAIVRLNADGSHDPSFSIGTKLTSVWAIAFQDDGQLLVGGIDGTETSQTGFPQYRVFRFDQNGGWDSNYNSPVFRGIPRFMTLQPDGNLLVVPSNGDSGNGGIATIARLWSDGVRDWSFVEPNLEWGWIFAPPVVADNGQVYIGGVFDTVDGLFRPGVARLNADGTHDTAWEPTGFSRPFQVRGLAMQQIGDNAGKLIVAAGPTQVESSSDPDANRPLIRLNLDGTIDPSFTLVTQSEAGMYNRPRLLERLDDDSLVIVGGGVARFDANGALYDEQSYTRPFFSTEFFWMEALADGSVIVPPQFGATINDQPAPMVTKFDPSGLVDPNFNAPELVSYQYPSRFEVVADGKILTWGQFDEVNGDERAGIARLNSDGSLDYGWVAAGFQAPSYVVSADVADDGSVLASVYNPDTFETTVVRLTADGGADPSFVLDGAVAADLGALETTLLANGNILVNGTGPQRLLDGTVGLTQLDSTGAIEVNFDASGLPALGAVYRFGDGSLDSVTVGYFEVLGEDDTGRILARTSVGPYNQRAGVIDATLVRLHPDGVLDTSFNAPRVGWSTSAGFPNVDDGGVFLQTESTLAGSPFQGLKVQPDGKILVYGLFTQINGQASSGLARLNDDGSLDTTFDIGSGAKFTLAADRLAQVTDVQATASGRIWVSGYFSSFDGVSASGLVLLEANGSVVSGFDSGLELVPYTGGDVTTRVINDETLLVGGTLRPDRTQGFPVPFQRISPLEAGGSTWLNDTSFSGPGFLNDTRAGRVTADASGRLYGTFVNGGELTGADGVQTGAVVRMFADGTVDTTFDIGTSLVAAWAVQPLDDGSVLVGGVASIEGFQTGFTNYRMFKFDENGVMDPSYRSPLFAGLPRFITMQPDGKLLVVPSGNNGGNGGVEIIARLNPDGSRDESFHQINLDGVIFAPPALDAEGRVYVGGIFSDVDGEFRPGVARLHADGALDVDWVPSGFSQPWQVRGLAIQQIGANAGKLLIAGGQTLVESSDDPDANRPVIRLNLDGTIDSTFTLVTQGDAGLSVRPRLIELMADDGFMVVGSSVARFGPNGALDTNYAQPVMSDEAFWFEMLADGSVIVPPEDGTTLGNTPLTAWVKFDSAGAVDTAFSGPQFESAYFPARFAVLPSGKILAWGRFSQAGGQAAPGILRMNADGSVDSTFQPLSLDPNNAVVFAELTDDGRILASVSEADGSRTVLRLLPDGAVDTSFTIDPGLGDLDGVEIGQLGDGRVLVWASSAQRLIDDAVGIGRLLADGTLDSTFDTDDNFPDLGVVYRNEDGSIRSITQGNFRQLAVQNDGGIIARSSVRDYPENAGATPNTIVRLNADGSRDMNFNAPEVWWSTSLSFPFITDAGTNGGAPIQIQTSVASSPFSGALAQDDGKVLVFGLFTDLEGYSRPGLARLNADGSVDESFDVGTGAEFLAAPGRSGQVTDVSPAPGGQFWVSGFFDTFDGLSVSGLVLLDRDGDVVDRFETDLEFAPFVGNGMGVRMGPDETAIVGGTFFANGGPVSAFHRLRSVLGFAEGGLPAETWFAGNTEVILEVELPTDRALTYVWRKDGEILTGETGPKLFISGASPDDVGTYEVTVDDGQGGVISTATVLRQVGRPMSTSSIYGVGDLPGGIFLSEIRDATKVGDVIYAVGTSTVKGQSTNGDTGVLWRSDSGLFALPALQPGSQGQGFVSASGITPDAAFVAARSRVDFGDERQAVRVDTNDYSQLPLAYPEGFRLLTAATSISDDGSILYGFGYNVDFNIRGIRYDAVNETSEEVPLPDGNFNTMFTAGGRGTTSDGSVVVGQVYDDAAPGFDRGFRYEHGVGAMLLPQWPSGSWSDALAVSGDGMLTLMRGDSFAAPYGELFLHDTATGELTPLGSPNTAYAPLNIMGMTSDADVVVGAFYSFEGDAVESFFRNANGWFPLHAAVHTLGIALEGWELREAIGISRDGTLVFGEGFHRGEREGFVVEFPAGYLASFDAPAQPPVDDRIVGTWVYYRGDGSGIEEAVIAFAPDGTYVLTQVASPEEINNGGATGMERGSYTFETNGSFGLMTTVDSNGDIGLGDLSGRQDLTASVDEDFLTLLIPGDEGAVLERLNPESGTLHGGWAATYSDGDFSFAAFLPNGRFYWAESGPSDGEGRTGVEVGTYDWNSEAKTLTYSFEDDTNERWGISGYGEPLTLAVDEFLRTLSVTDQFGTDRLELVVNRTIDITENPAEAEVLESGSVVLSVVATGDGFLEYQWRRNGTPLSGMTGSSLILTDLTPDESGLYDVVITSPNETRVSQLAEVVVNAAATTGRALVFLSTRSSIGDGETLYMPFRIEGTDDKTVLLRAVGPALASFGISGTMSDPRLQLVDELGFPVASNDDWSTNESIVAAASAAVGAFPLASESKDAALVALLPPGNYVAIIEGDSAGVVLAELYELDFGTATSRLVHAGVVAPTGPGSQSLVFGFVVPTSETHPMLVRAVGPGSGLDGAIADPNLVIYDLNGVTLGSNDNWNNAVSVAQASMAAGAPPLPADSNDAAERLLIGPGAYSMVVTDNASGSGFVLAEIYEINNRTPSATPVMLVPPHSRTVNEGLTARFETYVAGAGPLGYQWFKGTTEMTGETNPNLIIQSAAPADAGDYTLAITNSQGTFVAYPVTLTVVSLPLPLPVITTQPVDATITADGTALLTVGADRPDSVTYQWYQGSSGDTSQPMSGATQAGFETPPLSTSQSYWVRVTNGVGDTDSDTVTVTVQMASTITATHALVEAGFRPGETVTINTTLTYEGDASGIGWQVQLPAGWSYASTSGANAPPFPPNPGDTGEIAWAYIAPPASPASFSYTLNVPADAEDPVQLISNVLFRDGTNPEQTIIATPSPLTISPAPAFHTADTDGDNRFGLSELLRVIEIYNTRFGTTRTGHYQVESGTEDGFATNPNLSGSESGNLARFHAADSNRDGKLGLSELLRVIELYNYREGTVRTGAYRAENGTEDGFAPGPAPTGL